MLLARQRLDQIKDILTRKTTTGANVTDLEHRILYLASKAFEMMSDNAVAPPDAALAAIDLPGAPAYATPLGQGVSRFAVMGSMGPDFTGFSAVLAPGNSWVFDIVHKGNPDQNREPVVARTTDFVLEFWRQVAAAIDTRTGATPADKQRAQAQMRAYVLGHLCHIVGDVISHPFINDIEWHLGTGSRHKFTHPGGESSLDAKIAQQLLLRSSTREGQAWAVWWPTPDTVPPEFFTAYDGALEQIYNARSHRPAGFGEFEAEFTQRAPPPLTAQFVRDGYAVYRNAILPIGYGWGYWRWWAFLMPLVLPLLALFPLALALPAGRELTQRAVGDVQGDRPFSEVLTLPLALTAVVPLFYGIWVASITSRGAEGLTVGGIITAVASALAAITYLITLFAADTPWWLRWIICFGIPVAIGIFFLIKALANSGPGEGGRRGLAFMHALPLLFALAFALLYFLSVGIGALAHSPTGTKISFGVITGLFILVVGITWFILPKTLRDARIPERPDPFPAERPHFVRLFDDTTLFHDPAVAGDATLAQRFYPSARRPLLKLWWEGGGDLYIRSRRFKLEFSFSGQGDPVQTVPAPIAPMKAVEYAHYLTATVKDGSGATGKLKAAMVYSADLDYELPPGASFADQGDPDEENVPDDFSAAQHDRAAQSYQKLGTSQDSTTCILYHAPKAMQAVRFGRNGPVPFDLRETGAPGLGHVSSSGIHVTGDNDSAFMSFFVPGDQIGAQGQVRTVTLVESNSKLTVSSAFNPDLPSGTQYSRIGPERETTEGYVYVASPPATSPGGETIMDYAADVAAVLCLGATPHLLSAAELRAPLLAGKTDQAGHPIDPGIGKIYQVFRNWSLDRRRINEWRMLVAGGALNEKGQAADGYDSAMTQPRDPGWALRGLPPEAEATVLARGWARVLREWLIMSGNTAQNGIDPAGRGAGAEAPANVDLSRAVAFMFDMPDPVTVH
jgi:hypothetical protein